MVNRAQARAIGSDVQRVDQFVDRIIGSVFAGYAHRQHHFDALLSTLSDAFSHVNPLECRCPSFLSLSC